jgi:PAS domain-containing protein
MHSWVNHVRCGLDACFAWLAVMLAAGVWPLQQQQEGTSFEQRDAFTRATLAALPGAFFLAALLSYLRWRRATYKAMQLFRAYLDQRVAGDLAAFFPFCGPHEAVLVARRAARRWADREEGLLEPDAPRMAGLVLAAASARFPGDSGVMLAQAAFAGRIMGDPARARSTAERAGALAEAGGGSAGGAAGGGNNNNDAAAAQAGAAAAAAAALAVGAAGVAGAGGGAGGGGRPGFSGSDSDGPLGALADRYAAFALSRAYGAQAEAKASASGVSRGVDLAAFLEAERQLRLAAKAHRRALSAMRGFWRQLLHSQVGFRDLVSAMAAVEDARVRAERTYKVLLERFPGDARLVRAYARFLEDVRGDAAAASRQHREAQRLERGEDALVAAAMEEQAALDEAAMQAATQDVGEWDKGAADEAGAGGGGGGCPAGGGGGGALEYGGGGNSGYGSGGGGNNGSADGAPLLPPMLRQVSDRAHGVIVINAFGTIQMANRTALKAFGYRRADLDGKNVSMLMPQPFAARHNAFLRNTMTTGE